MSADDPLPEVGWDIPGWDWPEGDFSWLASESGLWDPETQTNAWFVHGGRVRVNAHVPAGRYSLAEFTRLFEERSAGLDDPRICWSVADDEDGASLWIEGSRPPNDDDLRRLASARERQERTDKLDLKSIVDRHPDWRIEVRHARWNATTNRWERP